MQLKSIPFKLVVLLLEGI